MAGQWVDDPSWGNVFNGLFDSGVKPGQAMLAAEHVKALQLKRARDEDELAALRSAVAAISPRYDAMQPPRFLPDPNAGPLYRGGIEDVLANNIPPTTAAGDAPFYRGREQARRDEILATQLSKTPAQLYQTRGLGQVTTSGAPTTTPEWNRVQTMLKGELPDPNKTGTIHNWSVTDPMTGEVKGGITLNGLTDARTGERLPQTASVFTGQPHQQPSAFGDQKAAQDDLARTALRVRSGQPLSVNDVERMRIVFDRAFPQSGEFVDLGGRKVWQITRKDAVPEWAQPIAGLINDYHGGAHLRPPQQQVPGGGAEPAPAPISAPAPDINQPRQVGPPGPINALNLADNMRAEPEYKTYQTVVGKWNDIVRISRGGYDGNFSNSDDLALIYAIAKLFDPGSAVREGELHLTQNLGAIGETLRAWYTRTIVGGGILPAKVRADLLYDGQRLMETQAENWQLLKETYEERAQRGGVDPRDIVPKALTPLEFDYPGTLERGKRSEQLQSTQQPPGPVPPIPQQSPNVPVPRSVIEQLLQGGP